MADYCQELAQYATGRVRATQGDARDVAVGLVRDALVVEAEVLVHMANEIAQTLASAPGEPDFGPFGDLFDRLLTPILHYASLPNAFDDVSSRRIRGLLAACAGAVLTKIGARISERALSGTAEDGEIERLLSVLAKVRALVLPRVPGLPWIGMDALMVRWKQFGQQARELADVAVTTRALGRLAAASTAMRGAKVEGSALERLGRTVGDLAARSAADAEVDALLSGDNLQDRVEQGMARVRRDLGKR